MKKVTLALLLLVVAASSVPTLIAPARAAPPDQWTPEEMQAVYEINLARRSPVLWGIEHGVDLSGVPARPPLAPNDALAASAGFSAADLAAFGGAVDPDYPHVRSDGRWPNQVARDFGYPLPDWWIDPPGQPDSNNYIESYAGGNAVFPLVDLVAGDPWHKDHLLGISDVFFSLHREIGIGQSNDTYWWVVHTGYEENSDPFITGVAFSDANGNGVMDLGEGLPGVTVAAAGRSTTTNAGGGWALQVPSGTYIVTASGSNFTGTSSAKVAVGNYNVGVDFVSGRSAARVIAFATCAGYAPTILGTNGNDLIYGTRGRDIIYAGDGNDTIYAGNGRDIVCGGTGRDKINGGSGPDRIYGNAGNDVLIGRPGSDHIYGGNGDDTLIGNRRNDHLYGGRGNDLLSGRPGSDTLNGGSGIDTGDGGSGSDTCSNLTYQASCEQ
jgi:Ca2+-binding RTX toxin-like protein